MKWLFYLIVLIYMFYRAVYGAKIDNLVIDPVNYGDNGFLMVGEHKTIICKQNNKNQKIEWIYPNGTVVSRTPRDRIFSQEHFVPPSKGGGQALVLTIKNAIVADTGVYECRSGALTKSVSLCVIEPSEFIETPTEVSVLLGRSITLTCQSKGDPEPRLVWNRNGETIIDENSSGKYKVMTKYNLQGFEEQLTITSLEAEDSGIYSCVSIQESIQVDDCINNKTYNITLNVKYAPIFDDGNETIVYGKINQEVEMVCSAQGFPLPTYRWFKEIAGGTLFEYDEKQIKFIEEGNQAVLTVELSSATLDQRFKCQAINDLGSSDKYFTLKKTEKPKPIDEVSQIGATAGAALLNVTWYDKIVFPVDAFIIQYVQDSEDNKHKYKKDVAWKASEQSRVEIDDENLSWPDLESINVTLTGLEEETTYYVRLRASNEAGYSPWSDPIFVNTEVTEIPEEQQSVIEYNISDTSFYGIFFAGGILVVAFVCMLGMRMVK